MATQGLEQVEWDFRGCPEDELEYCTVYEYARESDIVCGVVAKYKKLIHDLSSIKDVGFPDDQILQWPLDQRRFFSFLYFLDVGGHGEFWRKPWLQISPLARRQWISKLPDKWTESWAEQSAVYVGSLSELKRLEKWRRRDRPGYPPRAPFTTFHLIEIDWRYNEEQIANCFQSWLGDLRPPDVQKADATGVTSWRERLKFLGAHRLSKAMTQVKAGVHTQRTLDEPLYAVGPSWSDAVGKAKRIMKELESTGWIGPLHRMKGWVAGNLT
jgi:hypothetical protein